MAVPEQGRALFRTGNDAYHIDPAGSEMVNSRLTTQIV
jgi:hypothetical protein